MQLRVSEAAAICGVSVRTLQYYDSIGLVPTHRTAANYRVYTDAELLRLQEALFFRELGFSLAQMQDILKQPGYDRVEALKKHRALLAEKQRQTEATLRLLDDVLEGKEMKTDKKQGKSYEQMKAQYRGEVVERWGDTEAFRISEEKDNARTATENDALQREAEAIFDAFAALVPGDPASAEAQALVQRWQNHISAHHYPCTNEILAGLGEMYVGDERFMNNLDAHGAGTAQLMHDAIAVYCKKA